MDILTDINIRTPVNRLRAEWLIFILSGEQDVLSVYFDVA